MANPPRIAFFGADPLAVPILEELMRAGIEPLLIVTGEDKPVGRNQLITPPRTKVWAEEHGIEVIQPHTLRDGAELDLLQNSEWDLFLVASYGKILPERVLALPKRGVLNVHPSLLPKLRGASPVRTALLQDLRDQVGVSVMLLDEEMDHGPLVAQASVELPIWPLPAPFLEDLLAREGARLLVEAIPLWLSGEIVPDEQAHDDATYSRKFTKTDGELDLAADAYANYLRYCACAGWPGTYFFIEQISPEGKAVRMRVKVSEAVFEHGAFCIQKVVPEGKHEMSYDAFMRSNVTRS